MSFSLVAISKDKNMFVFCKFCEDIINIWIMYINGCTYFMSFVSTVRNNIIIIKIFQLVLVLVFKQYPLKAYETCSM